MTESKESPKKTLEERAKELLDDVRDFLEELIPRPEPVLIPVEPRRRPRRS
ncbi:MAG: hypothetical protein AAGF12_40895 [Myxococcota bacterium]